MRPGRVEQFSSFLSLSSDEPNGLKRRVMAELKDSGDVEIDDDDDDGWVKRDKKKDTMSRRLKSSGYASWRKSLDSAQRYELERKRSHPWRYSGGAESLEEGFHKSTLTNEENSSNINLHSPPPQHLTSGNNYSAPNSVHPHPRAVSASATLESQRPNLEKNDLEWMALRASTGSLMRHLKFESSLDRQREPATGKKGRSKQEVTGRDSEEEELEFMKSHEQEKPAHGKEQTPNGEAVEKDKKSKRMSLMFWKKGKSSKEEVSPKEIRIKRTGDDDDDERQTTSRAEEPSEVNTDVKQHTILEAAHESTAEEMKENEGDDDDRDRSSSCTGEEEEEKEEDEEKKAHRERSGTAAFYALMGQGAKNLANNSNK